MQQSAHTEAINHLTTALELLKTLPDTRERARKELSVQTTLGPVLMAAKGVAAPEVGATYARARELCQQGGESALLFAVLVGLRFHYTARAEHDAAQELAEQIFTLAQRAQDPALLIVAHRGLAGSCFALGKFAVALEHAEQGVALYDPQQHHTLAFFHSGVDHGVTCLGYAALALWYLGYPDQARKKMDEMLILAQELSHPVSLGWALYYADTLHSLRREIQRAQERGEALIALGIEHEAPHMSGWGIVFQGWTLAMQEEGEKGIVQLHRGLADSRAIGMELFRPHTLTLLAETYRKVGQIEEGLDTLSEALTIVRKTGERAWEAELYRLTGELTLQSQTSLRQVSDKSGASHGQVESKSKVTNPQPLIPNPQAEAEACFHKAIDIARKQQAKSLELRATMSLARLWQQQDKREEARQMLAEIYGWFTEGFDTADLKEAKALLDELS